MKNNEDADISRQLCTVTFISASILIVLSALIWPPVFMGDGWEYALVTEAFINHATPNVEVDDIKSHLLSTKYHAAFVFSELSESIETQEEEYLAFFKSNNGTYYGWHFPLYSLFNVPAKLILGLCGFDQDRHFQLTNAFFYVLMLWYVLLYSKQDTWYKLTVTLGLMLCGGAWYSMFTHPEMCLAILFLMGATAYLDRHYKQALLFNVLAAIQNIAFAAVLPFFWLAIVWLDSREEGEAISTRNRTKQIAHASLIGSGVAIPWAYYYWNYRKVSLLGDMVDFDAIGLRRLHSLFFDLNQGAIVAFAPVFLVALLLVLHGYNRRSALNRERPSRLTRLHQRREHVFLLLPFALSVPFMTQANWNGGYIYVMRYAFLASLPVLVWVAVRIPKTPLAFRMKLLLPTVTLLCMWNFNSAYFERGGHFTKLTNVARLVWDTRPSLYNPDPEIFVERVGVPGVDKFDFSLPISDQIQFAVYRNQDGAVRKAILRPSAFKQYSFYLGDDRAEIQKKDIRFREYPVQGVWGYVNGPISVIDKDAHYLPPEDLGKPIPCNRNSSFPAYIKSGFSAEDQYSWTVGTESVLLFNTPYASHDLQLTVELSRTYGGQVVTVLANGTVIATWECPDAAKSYTARIPDSLRKHSDLLEIRFQIPNARAPFDVTNGESTDRKLLGMQLLNITISNEGEGVINVVGRDSL